MLLSRVKFNLRSKITSAGLWNNCSRRLSTRLSGPHRRTSAMTVPTALDRKSLSVAVIGGGAAGLVAARELLREGHSVCVYEKGDKVGGVWVYSEEAEDDPLGLAPGRHKVHGSMYAQLRTNLPRQSMGFSDFPFDEHFPGSQDPRQFCSHEEVQRYLESFAEEFQLGSVVQTGTEVVAVRPLERSTQGAAALELEGRGSSDGAATAMERGSSSSSSSGGGMSDCSSSSSSSIDGEYGHSREEAGEQWEVTVQAALGRGSAPELPGPSSSTLWYDAVVVCNGHYAEPRVPRFPGQLEFPGLQMHSHNYRRPEGFRDQTVLLLGAAASGVDIAKELAGVGARVYLCARAWENPLTGEPLDTTLHIREAKPGEVLKAANIRELHADGSVTLDSGFTVPRVDTVMYCTGYHYDFPFLEGTNIVKVEDNRVGPLYQHIFPPAHSPGLSFIGLTFKMAPLPQFELQAKWVARVLSGRSKLPSPQEMERAVLDFYAQLEAQGVPVRYTHRQAGDIQWQYNNWLAKACGPDVPVQPSWRRALYEAAGRARKVHEDTYRDHPLPGVVVSEEAAKQEAAAVWAKRAQAATWDETRQLLTAEC